MYYTGMDPFTKEPVYIAKSLKDRKMQRALMQFFKPENYFEVREALREAGRHDLIGNGCDCLIPAQPPREAIERRRDLAGEQFRGEYVHRIGQSKRTGQTERQGKERNSEQRSRGKGRQAETPNQSKRKQGRGETSLPDLPSGRKRKNDSRPGDRLNQGKQNKRKGARKQSRYAPGQGYRPDRKAKRLRDSE
jgi:hypothetical protein